MGTTAEVYLNWGLSTIQAGVHTDQGSVVLEGRSWESELIQTGPGAYHVLCQGRSIRLTALQAGPGLLRFQANGTIFQFPVYTKAEWIVNQMETKVPPRPRKATNLYAPMPGLVLQVLAMEGQQLEAGDPLLVLESMKMENVLRCSESVQIAQIRVTPGQTVDKGQALINFR